MADSNQDTAAVESPAAGAGAASPDAKAGGAQAGKAAGKSSGGPLLMIAAVVSLLVGAGVGMFVLGPKLIGSRGVHAVPAANAETASGKGDAKADAKAKPVLFKLDNIIVNPAGAQGAHFLMASVAFEVPDDRVETRLRDREVQVRDVVIATLERQTMETLVQPGVRDAIKHDLTEAVTPIAAPTAWLHVYLPQFVIQ
ncbi:MAG: flagellar basal body-associated FliL family protein [Candidatus Eiseniibacteriota bacterium]